jgi:serine phosphatase RsbU (regulator of sigma subunit)
MGMDSPPARWGILGGASSLLSIFCFLFFVPLCFAQTTLPGGGHNYLMPGDSIWHELSLQAGDQMTWNLWLAAGDANAGSATLSLVSSVEGKLWQRQFGPEGASAREDVKITKPARYRLTLTSNGKSGRVADLGAWAKYGPSNRTPFPPPSVQKIAESFNAGDKFVVEFEFLFADTLKLQTLRDLDLPKNLAAVWAITPLQDSIAAAASVSRWLGDAGLIRLREGSPKGGTITLRLELDMGEGGESTIYIAPGAKPPVWLPHTVRMTTIHQHSSWNAVIVPPIAVLAETLASRAPDPPRAPYAAISFRAHGLDSTTVRQLTEIYAERDSLMHERYLRRKSIVGYDTLFLTSAHAFLPPDLHAAMATPLARKSQAKIEHAHTYSVTWFVEGSKEDADQAKLYAWRYNESRAALPSAKDEIFWDSSVLTLEPELHVHHAAVAAQPATMQLAPPRPLDERMEDKRRYIETYQNIWGLFLENSSKDTLVLVWKSTQEIERPLLSGIKRWPKLARYAVVIFAILGLLGVVALYELRRREAKRKNIAKELDAELEKARQVQLKLLPGAPLNVAGIEIYGLHQSMQSVGGDYYDFFPLEDGSVLICVADVAGHGLAAAMLMSNLQATLRAVAQSNRSVSEMVSLLNREMFNRTSPERFVTMLLAKISADRTLITICNAGHNPGYIVRTNGNIVELDAGGLMLGVMDIFPFIEIDEGLDPGDMVVFYTDGIPEATIGEEDMFGYDRLKYFLTNNRSERLVDIAQGLFRRVTPAGNGMIEDDMCIVLVRVKTERKAVPRPQSTPEKEKR